MKKSIKEQVAEILTELFGDEDGKTVFCAEKTIKRSGGNSKATEYELKTSSSWSATSEGEKLICVSCVGLTMSEFIKSFRADKIHVVQSKRTEPQQMFIYRDTPEWESSGFVKKVDLEKNELTLCLPDLTYIEEAVAPITPATPNWLYKTPPETFAKFSCHIYQYWRSFKSLEKAQWEKKVWETFELENHIPFDESQCLI